MAKRGKIAPKRKSRKKVQLNKKGSDESDEDYMVDEDEYCSSPAEDDSEESLVEFEEESRVKKKVKKVVRSKVRKSYQGRKNRKVVKARKRKVAYSEEEEEEEDCDDEVLAGVRRRKKSTVSHKEENEDDFGVKRPRKKSKICHNEDISDSEFDDSDDSDEEFTPDEVDSVDDEEELSVLKKKKVSRRSKTWIPKGQKRKRKAKVLKNTRRRKPIKKRVKRSNRSDLGKECRVENRSLREKKTTTERGNKKRRKQNIDPDFLSSESSAHTYATFEEEREQVREATSIGRRLPASFETSKEEEIVPSERKSKGKEKVVDSKIEVAKQVCGICLSEEGKRTVRGILNCCSHYFCFSCIMEWSRVESRCPICKQRFKTITRSVRLDSEVGLRDTVYSVSERDQVYQPSEEELRVYLDPYANLLCTECQQGGHDALMLLCDICDSPAHTYCVGLGNQVPEGNWYCDGCSTPAPLVSSNTQTTQNPTTNHGETNPSSYLDSFSSPVRTVRELNELHVPDTPPSQLTRHSVIDSGSGVVTLFERRRLQRLMQIQQLLRTREESERSNEVVPGNSLFASPMGLINQTPQNYSTPSIYSQEFGNQASTSSDYSLSGASCNLINPRISRGLDYQQQIRPCCGGLNGEGDSVTRNRVRELSQSPVKKEQVQSMVKSHLRSLSRNSELGYSTFKDIARKSTHTILAAAGLEHRWNEVYPVRTRPLVCEHFEVSANRQQACPILGQCSSCFDWFVRNVVSEIMQIRVSLSTTG